MGNRYAALVRGSSAIFPRGYPWLIPVWFTVVAVAFEIRGKPPAWYGDSALAGLSLATITGVAVLGTMRSNAFLADDGGIWLGLRAGARRRFGPRRRACRYLAWAEVRQLRIAARHYGARLDILLPPAAPDVRGRVVWQAAAECLTALVPAAYLFRSPGLTRPCSEPLRYRVPLYGVTPEELRLALAPLVPPAVLIAVLPRWRSRALGRLRRSRLTTAA